MAGTLCSILLGWILMIITFPRFSGQVARELFDKLKMGWDGK